MRRMLPAIAVLWPSLVLAAVLNVEFKFTPYTGDLKEDHVDSVPGTARVVVNGVPYAEQPVEKKTLPVIFDDREVAASVWVPVQSVGSLVRKGKNVIRIEFEPSDPKVAYKAQLRWASVTDQVKEDDSGAGSYRGTNQAGEGVESKDATGKVVFEREFTADFAKDRPWHHYPAVTALSDDDRQQLTKLVADRTAWFKPDFAAIYKILAANAEIKVAEVRRMKCIDAAYQAGARFEAAPADQLEFTTPGGPEVVVQRKGGGALYGVDQKAFEKIKGDDKQMCAGMTLSVVYPPRLVVVRSPGGSWEVVS